MATRLRRGGVIIPSSIGAGIQSAVLNFINVRNAKKASETEKEFEDRRISLQERRADVEEQSNAFERFLKLSSLIPTGSTLAENPFILPTARDAFGADLNDQQFSNFSEMVLSPETLDTVLNDREIAFTKGLESGDPRLERILNFRRFGEAVTDKEFDVRGKKSAILGDALDLISGDKEVLGDIALAGFGLRPEVSIPGIDDSQGNPIVFQSADVARIWAGMQDLTFQKQRLSSNSQKEIVSELIGQAKGADIALGRPQATRIIRAYETSVLGNFPEGQSPLEKLFSSSNDETKKAISLFTGAVRLGEDAFTQTLKKTEDGNSLLFMLDLSKALEERLPKAEVKDALKDLLPQFQGAGISISSPFFTRDKFIFEPSASAEPDARVPVSPEESAVQGEALPPDADPFVVSIQRLIQKGASLDAVLESAIRNRGEEGGNAAVDAAIKLSAMEAGGGADPTVVDTSSQITIDNLSTAFLSLVNQRNALDQQSVESVSNLNKQQGLQAGFKSKLESNKIAREARKLLDQIRAINPAKAQELERQISR